MRMMQCAYVIIFKTLIGFRMIRLLAIFFSSYFPVFKRTTNSLENKFDTAPNSNLFILAGTGLLGDPV